MSSDEEDYGEESEYETDEIEMDDDSDKFLTPSDLTAEMNLAITDAQSILQVNAGVCRLLLQKFKWNKNSLLDKFYENPDTNEFLTKSNIIPCKLEPIGSQSDECEICCMESELVGLQCNHLACQECWTHYLSERVKANQSEIECMTTDCKLLIPDEQIKKFICDENLKNSFDRVTINNYVEANPYLTWCPADYCSKAVKVVNTGTRLITCPCGTIFCFTCGNDGHDPVSCRHLKLWQKKCEEVKSKATTGDGYSSDNDTFKWILSNTKDCPQCLTAIEKNGGCNRILCRNKKCMFEFCWLCMKSWAIHGYSACNIFTEEAEKKRVDSRAELLRLQFYLNRFMEHDRSLQLEKKLVRTVETQMEKIQDLTKSWTETQFLRKAVDVLSECRRTLKFTYAFAYYLERNNHALLFETNQKDLEMAVEQLSGFLEKDLENDDVATLKQKVQDKSRYVEHRRKVLVDHCFEGNEQEFWSFRE
ncbi:hypothetical protein CAEBREN_15615 [Caenorhabditis brenneri]|uniref:RBR-type E3 ubiquitin transferase n=1 Tax=Caenorhabditis brenneri TaxID=135651 RepID=G0P859_CAEBE|nr:hypothetical protein CAEBREN_15615 [Caenorhabditis brenneri]